MKRGYVIIFLLTILALLIITVSGCKQSVLKTEEIKELCINECLKQKDLINLSSQCLLNPIPETNWVCDIAHNPRTEEDNIPDNQCSSYREGKAKHFIEVTPECIFIGAN